MEQLPQEQGKCSQINLEEAIAREEEPSTDIEETALFEVSVAYQGGNPFSLAIYLCGCFFDDIQNVETSGPVRNVKSIPANRALLQMYACMALIFIAFIFNKMLALEAIVSTRNLEEDGQIFAVWAFSL